MKLHLMSAILGLALISACSEENSTSINKKVGEYPSSITDQLSEQQFARIKEIADTWQPQALYSVPYDTIDPNISVSIKAVSSRFNPDDEYWGLPRENGTEELVAAYCSACHSLRIVMQQHASQPRWDELLNWMVEKQNMPPLETEDLDHILNYLAKHFSN